MFKVSIKSRTVDVAIEDENGNEIKYKLKQMTGAEADEFRAVKLSKIELNDKGEAVGVKDVTGQFTDLLVRTMVDASGNGVPITTLQQWPDEALKALYEQSAKLNKLSDDKDEELDPKKP